MAGLISFLRVIGVLGLIVSAIQTARGKLAPLGNLPGDLTFHFDASSLKIPLTTFALHVVALLLVMNFYSRKKDIDQEEP